MTTGQWADLTLTELVKKAKTAGFDGLELASWGELFEVRKAIQDDSYVAKRKKILADNGLGCWAIQAHLVGQAVLDNIDGRHEKIVPDYVWGDGNPKGVNERAANEMKDVARAAKKMGVSIVTGFTGSSIWPLLYSFPAVPPEWIDKGFNLFAEKFNPILDVFGECGVKFALEVHPTEIAFDLYSAERALEAIKGRKEFGFNFDPSHLIWQGVNPVEFIRNFKDRIFHVHMKDAKVNTNGRTGLLGSHLEFGDPRRGWDFRSLGHGDVNFNEIIRALNGIGYSGPLSVEWEDMGMDRDSGAKESVEFVRKIDFPASTLKFDSAFEKQ